MTQFTDSSIQERTVDDFNLAHMLSVLRRNTLPLLLTPLLLGAATYAAFNQQPRVYESGTSLMSSTPESGNNVVASSSITATQLPQGAVEEVIHSTTTVKKIEELLRKSDLGADVQQKILADLNKELSTQQFKRVTVRARLDQFQRGVYDLTARAESPEAARVLASAATEALLNWDLLRAQEGVTRAKENLQEQLRNINARIAAAPAGSVEQQSLISARGQLVLNLSQATVFEGSARGSLTRLSEAYQPSRPVAPKPLRNAVIAALLSLFVLSGLMLLLDSLRRRVRSSSDLIDLGFPVIGEMPKLKRSKRSDVPEAARNGQLYEPIGFVRVNLNTALPKKPMIIAFSSARPGEGKSTMAAATAASMAQSGKRVLLIDLDLHRHVQGEFWNFTGRPWVALPGSQGTAQASSVRLAVQNPQEASAIDVGNGVHLLPAGTSGGRTDAILNSPLFSQLLHQWAEGYDVVVLDTPPLLSLADGLLIARQTDGLILVVENDQTSIPELQRIRRSIQNSGVNLLGAVLNKVKRSQQEYYSGYATRAD